MLLYQIQIAILGWHGITAILLYLFEFKLLHLFGYCHSELCCIKFKLLHLCDNSFCLHFVVRHFVFKKPTDFFVIKTMNAKT